MTRYGVVDMILAGHRFTAAPDPAFTFCRQVHAHSCMPPFEGKQWIQFVVIYISRRADENGARREIRQVFNTTGFTNIFFELHILS